MQGRIIKGIAGFYYVSISGQGVCECKAKGVFRKDGTKPLVGDSVEIDMIDQGEKIGNICAVNERKNELIRPAVANVDQALVIFAMEGPAPNLYLLDTFLVCMEQKNIPCIICFNKEDLMVEDIFRKELTEIYAQTGYELVFTSTKYPDTVEALKQKLSQRTTTVAGPSGVGKSSLINLLQDKVNMDTGAISVKTERGKHTTRHSELIAIDKDSYIIDTPGFSALRAENIEKEEIGKYFPEFRKPEKYCRFAGCSHIHEPVCGVKQALVRGKISRSRYESYVMMYEECKEKRRY